MRLIARDIWSHSSSSSGRQVVSKIRHTKPGVVSSFRELVEEVAHISFRNPNQCLFFRGQQRDFRSPDGTTVLPTIFRDGASLVATKQCDERFEVLARAEQMLIERFEEHNYLGQTKLRKLQEIRWAILQHYKVCDTPLLDLTHSLRVAASFALLKGGDGCVLVFGFPHPSGSISYSVEEELLNVRLFSICPPRALRPHYQEAFLVGTFPYGDHSPSSKLDVGRRLIAKYHLHSANFWDEHFPPIPTEALHPDGDTVQEMCDIIRADL